MKKGKVQEKKYAILGREDGGQSKIGGGNQEPALL